VLNLSVVEALSYFREKPILATLEALKDVGLGTSRSAKAQHADGAASVNA
jgi:hypothetical protein